ncbi:MAG: low molecular weight protein-tyrosine-phosphatase [Bacillota bacterium]|jgi:protein-tyrosine phosphatase
MIKVLFICHGNICRSAMAEFVLKKMVADLGKTEDFYICSAATSCEEIGNPIHSGTVKMLRKYNIPFSDHRAVQIIRDDYNRYDYILTMDRWNTVNALRIFGGDPKDKVHGLLDYTTEGRDIADPWYSGDFEATYKDIKAGCEGFLRFLKEM